MFKQVLICAPLIIISTLCYNLPSQIINLHDIDISKVPEQFYSFYCLLVSAILFQVAFYALYLLILTNPKYYVSRVIFLWVLLAEWFTFADHVLRKYMSIKMHSGVYQAFVLLIMTACCAWFIRRALYRQKSDFFEESKSYIVRFKPKNISGIFNYIINRSGHAAIYQDGVIYKFKRENKKVEQKKISPGAIRELIKNGNISVEKIQRNERVGSIVGRKYSQFKFNCNHLADEAKKCR